MAGAFALRVHQKKPIRPLAGRNTDKPLKFTFSIFSFSNSVCFRTPVPNETFDRYAQVCQVINKHLHQLRLLRWCEIAFPLRFWFLLEPTARIEVNNFVAYCSRKNC